MKVDKYKASAVFDGEDGETLTVVYDNRGDPYTEGVTLELRDTLLNNIAYVYLEQHEARKLANLINRLYPDKSA